MTTSTYFSLLLIIPTILISHAISQTSNPNLYEAICAGGVAEKHQQERCLKLLESNPQITSAKDYLTLSKAYLEMAIEKATKGKEYLKSLINKYPSSQALNTCATKNYDDLIYGFQLATSVVAGDPDGAHDDVSNGSEGPRTCDQSLANENIVHDPSVSALNDDMVFLCYIGGEAIDAISH
ncbi:unnamed protein product [Lathyrus sativus]|nr:unnamed protein product [Lathyrus sativus]